MCRTGSRRTDLGDIMSSNQLSLNKDVEEVVDVD